MLWIASIRWRRLGCCFPVSVFQAEFWVAEDSRIISKGPAELKRFCTLKFNSVILGCDTGGTNGDKSRHACKANHSPLCLIY